MPIKNITNISERIAQQAREAADNQQSSSSQPSLSSASPGISEINVSNQASDIEARDLWVLDTIISSKPAFNSFDSIMDFDVTRIEDELITVRQLIAENDLFGDVVSNSPSISRLKSALFDSESNTALKKSRLATLKAYAEQATSAMKNLVNTMQDQDVKETISILNESNHASILQDISNETVSTFEFVNKKLAKKPLQVPSSLNSVINSEQAIERIMSELHRVNDRSTKIAYVGLPSRLLETLRRDTNLVLADGQNEYVVIKIAKRHVIYSDIVFEPVTFIVSPQLEVTLNSDSPGNDIANPIANFYCYSFDAGWTKKDYESASRFISDTSDIVIDSARQIVYNHFLSSVFLERLCLQNGISFVDSCLTHIDNNTKIDPVSKRFFDSVFEDGLIVTQEFVDNLLIENDDGSFVVPEFSQLTQDQITSIGAVEYRLLHQIASDAIFTGKSIYSTDSFFPAFEKVYALLFSSNDFAIDVEKTCATSSGKFMFEYLRKEQKINSLENPILSNPSIRNQSLLSNTFARNRNNTQSNQVFLSENEDNSSLSQFVVSIKLVKR